MQDYVNAAGRGAFMVASSDLAEIQWDLPLAATAGHMRAIARGVRGASCSVGIGVLPVGQRSPVHSSSAEHLLLGLDGLIVFRVGEDEFELGPMDLLFIPAGPQYEYRNAGFTQASFVDVLGRVDEWPPSATYGAEVRA